MHLAWWQERSQDSVLASSLNQDFFRLSISDAAGAGFVELSCRYHHDEIVSAFVIFRHGRVRYFYQSALNPDFATIAPGVGHMADELTRAIVDGAVTFDLLRGEESYKRRWATSAGRTWRAKGSLR
ncbi:MAG: GNAT family N-acetyltransferase [Mycobacteriales bacterium]